MGLMMLFLCLHPALSCQEYPRIDSILPFQMSHNESTSARGLLYYAAPKGVDRCLTTLLQLKNNNKLFQGLGRHKHQHSLPIHAIIHN